jgi:hypothetical protein
MVSLAGDEISDAVDGAAAASHDDDASPGDSFQTGEDGDGTMSASGLTAGSPFLDPFDDGIHDEDWYPTAWEYSKPLPPLASPVGGLPAVAIPVGAGAMPAMAGVYGNLGNTTSESTEGHIRAIWSHWVMFCRKTSRTPPSLPHTGLSLYYASAREDVQLGHTDRLNTILGSTSELVIDFHVLNQFLGFQAGKPDMTKSNFEKTATFLRSHLKAEYTVLRNRRQELKRPKLDVEDPTEKVSGSLAKEYSRFGHLRNEVMRRKSDQEMRNGTDIQASKERMITNKERFELLKEAFVPTDPKVAKLHVLSRTCFAAQFNKSFQMAKRGEALRSHTFAMVYAEEYRVGPNGDLMAVFALSNKGKENAVGRRTCTAQIAHYDAAKDATGMDGFGMMLRFGGLVGQKTHFAMGEPLPNFLDPVVLLNHHIYPSIGGGATTEIPANTYQNTWSTMFKSCKIICDKVTHQGRKQSQQELDFKLCPPEQIARHAGYSQGGAGNKNQNQSYLTNQCVGVLSSLAGSPYGHTRPETHSPGYLHASIDDLLVKLFEVAGLGSFLAARLHVHEVYARYSTRKELADLGLFMAKGAISYFYESVKRSFLIAASRPMHFATPNRLNRESERLYELFKAETGTCVFRNPVFDSPEFKILVERVTAAQERADDNVFEVSTEAENAISLAVKDNCAGPVERLSNEISAMGSRFDKVWNENGLLRNENGLLQSENAWLRGLLASHGLEVPEEPLFACPTATDTHAVVSPTNSNSRRQTGFFASGNAMDEEGDSDSEQEELEDYQSSKVEAAWKSVERLAPADDTTVDGDPRKRKRAVTQVEQGTLEETVGCPYTCTLQVGNKRTIYEYWNEYAHGVGDHLAYRDLQERYGNAWRKGIPGLPRPKDTVWCQLRKIYDLIEFYMKNEFLVWSPHDTAYESRKLTESEALLEANKTFQACLNKKGRPNFRQKLVPKFREQLLFEKSVPSNRLVNLDAAAVRFIPGQFITDADYQELQQEGPLQE